MSAARRIGFLAVAIAGWFVLCGDDHAAASDGTSSVPASSLSALIEQAEEGAVVTIPTGVYEGPLRIAKAVRLQADPSGPVVLRNETAGSALLIEADHVQISGLEIVDTAVKEAPSVLVRGNEVRLDSMHIRTGSDGIKLEEAQDGEITGNVVEWGGAHATPFTARGNGIDLRASHGVQITGNTVRGVFDGIYLELSDDSYVEANVIEQSRYGIHCMYTNRTVIVDNTGRMNITGGMIMAVRDVVMTGNTFQKQSENVNSQGILLFDAHDSAVSDNMVEGNRVGMYVEYSTNNEIKNNAVTHNFIGIQLLESSGNHIRGNRFSGNVTDAMARGNADNTITGNFWDSFAGIDVDGDGYSDIRYAINPFFQSVIDKKAAFQLFFQSPGLTFLESLFAQDRSNWTTDTAPLMAPPDTRGSAPHTSAAAAGIAGTLFLMLAATMLGIFRRRLA